MFFSPKTVTITFNKWFTVEVEESMSEGEAVRTAMEVWEEENPKERLKLLQVCYSGLSQGT